MIGTVQLINISIISKVGEDHCNKFQLASAQGFSSALLASEEAPQPSTPVAAKQSAPHHAATMFHSSRGAYQAGRSLWCRGRTGMGTGRGCRTQEVRPQDSGNSACCHAHSVPASSRTRLPRTRDRVHASIILVTLKALTFSSVLAKENGLCFTISLGSMILNASTETDSHTFTYGQVKKVMMRSDSENQ